MNKKFNPEITRVKLNPEQAVLQCSCVQGTRILIDTNQWTRMGNYTVCGWPGITRGYPVVGECSGPPGSFWSCKFTGSSSSS